MHGDKGRCVSGWGNGSGGVERSGFVHLLRELLVTITFAPYNLECVCFTRYVRRMYERGRDMSYGCGRRDTLRREERNERMREKETETEIGVAFPDVISLVKRPLPGV